MLLALLQASSANAQQAAPVLEPVDDSQLWSALQLAVPLRERLDLILSGSFRLGRNFTHPVYETGGSSLRFRIGRYFALSPVYQFVATQYYPEIHTIENRLSIHAALSIPIRRFVIDHAQQLEQRFRHPRNSNRYRNRLQVEWPFHFRENDYRFFLADEVYYDWSFHSWSRNRFFVGGGKRLSSNLGVDLFFVKQNARFSRPRDINGVGVTLRIRLDRPIYHLP